MVLFAFAGFIDAKIIPGKCPAVATKLDFDATPVNIMEHKK